MMLMRLLCKPSKCEVPSVGETPSNSWSAAGNTIDGLGVPVVRLSTAEKHPAIGNQSFSNDLGLIKGQSKKFLQAAAVSGSEPVIKRVQQPCPV